MKQVVFIKKENGYRTPEMIYDDLRKHSKLVSIVNDPVTGWTIEYFSLAETLGITDKVGEVTFTDGKVVSVRNVPAGVLKTVPPINVPEFGGF